MPPFPFPKELFPPGTFPPGMKFSTDFHMPPAVEELLESGGPDALAAMMAGADAPAGTSSFAFGPSSDDDDEWEDADGAGDPGGVHGENGRSARSRPSSRRAGAGPRSGPGSSRRGRGGFPGGAGPFPGFGPGGLFGMDGMDGMDGLFSMDGADDDELAEMFASIPPGAFEAMLRRDARRGGGAGKEAAALLEMLENDPTGEMRRAMMAGAAGGAYGGNGAAGRDSRRGGRAGGRGSSRRGRGAPRGGGRWGGGGAFTPGFFGPGGAYGGNGGKDDDWVDDDDLVDDDDAGSSPAPGANAARNKKKREKAKAKRASTKASAAAGVAPDPTRSPASPASSVTWSPKPPFASSHPTGGSPPDRDEIKRWCDAAKDGNVGAMRTMLAATPSLLHARGTGVGHTALHWACARGEMAVARWLLDEARADPNAVNSEGATPLHAAAANGRTDAVLALANAGADPGVRDSSGETPGDAARARGAVEAAAVFGRVGKPEEGVSGAGARVGGGAGFFAAGRGGGASTAGKAPLADGEPTGSPRGGSGTGWAESAAGPTADGSGSSSSSDDEDTKTAKLAKMSAEAKQKGNAAFSAGDYPKAVKQFTMAIRMDKQNHVLFSNRSASYAALGKYEEALADAERCVRLAPKWGKGYGRKGAALTGLGQGGEAVKAYLAGLAVEPESEALRGGLAEAKAAIRAAQDRYKEMWGKDAPPTDAVDAEAPPPPVETPRAPAGDHVSKQAPQPAAAAAEDLGASDQTAPSRDDVKENVAPLAPEVAAVTAAVNSLDKSDVRAWLAAAKDGDLARMKAMHSKNPELLYAWGKGTSLGFTANSAQHWAAAKGRLDVMRWLLAQGMSPDVRNNADSTPLHSAAGAGQDGSIRVLLLEGGADSTLRNGLDETPRDVAVGRKKGDGDSLAAAIDLCSRVAQLASAKAAGEAWPMRLMQAALQLAGRDLRMYSEKSEFIAATEELLGSMPSRIVPSGGATLPMPSLFARPEKGEAEPAKGEPAKGMAEPVAAAAPPPAAAPTALAADGSGSSSSSDDEDTKTAKLAKMSAEAKQKGNAAFSAGDYPKAVKQFTMAIRMDKQNHVLFSNRSASYAALGKYEEALADAERCVRLAPKWGKGYGRKGAALTGLGQGGEAVKAYLAGLAVEPESEALRGGLAEAKAAIRAAQDRYKEMWGKDAPGAEA